jgi:hypothetical protein
MTGNNTVTNDTATYALVVTGNSLVSGKTSIRSIELRETAKYLIDDKTGTRYVKRTVEGDESIAYMRSDAKWSVTRFDIYPVDCAYVKEVLQRNKRIGIIHKVRQEVENRKPSTYEDAVAIAALLGIEL